MSSRGSTSTPAAPEPTATVFVVDDDVSVRESLEGLIRLAGWKVATFASAREFLDVLPKTARVVWCST